MEIRLKIGVLSFSVFASPFPPLSFCNFKRTQSNLYIVCFVYSISFGHFLSVLGTEHVVHGIGVFVLIEVQLFLCIGCAEAGN